MKKNIFQYFGIQKLKLGLVVKSCKLVTYYKFLKQW